jgi:hypothetical protein
MKKTRTYKSQTPQIILKRFWTFDLQKSIEKFIHDAGTIACSDCIKRGLECPITPIHLSYRYATTTEDGKFLTSYMPVSNTFNGEWDKQTRRLARVQMLFLDHFTVSDEAKSFIIK